MLSTTWRCAVSRIPKTAADAFAEEALEILSATAPNLDLKAVAARGLSLGMLTTAEAEKLSIYATFPGWLESRLITANNQQELPTDEVTLLEPLNGLLSSPLGSVPEQSILAEFRDGNASSPEIVRIDGGASVHHVANFRKLAWADGGIISKLCDANARVLLPFLRNAQPVHLKGDTFLAVVEGSSVFTHWILDTLPRLILVMEEEGSLDRYDNFLFATDQTSFHRFTLESLGIVPSRVVTRQRQGQLFSVDSFTYVSAPRQKFAAHPRIYDMVTAFFLPDMAPVAQTRRLYISRNKAKRRRILNELEMFAALEARGFEILHLEELTIVEAAQALRSASHIVAAHGAGLSNLIFCQPGTRVLEIHSAHLSREYWVIANQRGLDYYGFEAYGPSGMPLTPTDRGAMGFFDRNGLDIHVPMELLLPLLDRAFLRRH